MLAAACGGDVEDEVPEPGQPPSTDNGLDGDPDLDEPPQEEPPGSEDDEPPTDDAGDDDNDGADNDTDNSNGTDDGTGPPDDGEELTTTNGVYSWIVPASLEIEQDEPGDQALEWANGEEEQSYSIHHQEGLELGAISVNVATDNDGAPPALVENVDTEPAPGAQQGSSQTYAVANLQSDCLEGEAGDPIAECGFYIHINLVSVPEGTEPTDDENWVFEHEIEGEEYPGNVLMGSRLGADTDESGMPVGIDYESAEAIVGSQEYNDVMDLFTSFTIN